MSLLSLPDAGTTRATQLARFMDACMQRLGWDVPDHAALERCCVTDFRSFWRLFLEESDLLVEGPLDPVCTRDDVETAVFFPRARLNYVENLLRIDFPDDGDRPAVSVASPSGPVLSLTRRELRDRVIAAADGLARLGLGPGDRVVAVSRNDADAVVAALAVLRLGATLSSASPDMGAASVLSRFRQLEPRFLITHSDGPDPRLDAVIAGLPSLAEVVVLGDGPVAAPGARVSRLAELEAASAPAGRDVAWERFPFNHPLFIMYTSGTTGPPKAIVHGAGGTLLEHVKEHRLHLDLRAGDTLAFSTSTAWMMWHWQLSALASSAEIVLLPQVPGNPETLWETAARHRVTVLGTSPPHLRMTERAGIVPRRAVDLRPLRALLSTGSVLFEDQYRWAEDAVGPVPLMSISGGTDIIGCFLLGSPLLPVHPGQLQCRSLGLDVGAEDVRLLGGQAAVGDLVCRNPFPSRPLGFVGDDDGTRFHSAYFADHPGMWTHGDLVEFTAEGGARIHGRSDGVLNVGGVRIGPAEIYTVVQELPQVREALAVEQENPDDVAGSRLVLVLVMERAGTLTDELRDRIRRFLLERGSPSHVPDVIVEVGELPLTYSGKRSEHAVRRALSGSSVENTEALRNPGALDVVRWQVRLEDGRVRVPRTAAGEGGRDEHEAVVLAAFREVLHSAGIGPDDDFFALGGTSLQVLRIFERIRDATGVTLPLSEMYHAATPGEIAALLRGSRTARSSPVLELRPGTGRPMFLLHDITGDLLYQRHVVHALDTQRPVFGVRAAEVDGAGRSAPSVQEMAAAYIDHVRVVQPVGPYTLVGYSFGGLVALEMARRLREDGDDVDFLGLVDSYVGSPHTARRWLRAVRGTMGRMAFLAAAPRTRGAGAVRRYAVRWAPWLNVRLTDDDLRDWPPAVEACDIANRAYRATTYRGDAVLYHATEFRPGLRRTDRDWRDVVTSLTCRPVPGTHITLAQPPHAARLAAAISADLPADPGAGDG